MSSTYPYLTRNVRPSRPALARGSGLEMTDSEGRNLFDFGAQTSNLAIGQTHPAIADAVVKQVRQLIYASASFSSKPFLELSRRLLDLAPDGLTAANLRMCNGSDAVETACKLARVYKWSPKILAVSGAWHGESIGTLAFAPSCKDSLLTTDRSVLTSAEPTLDSLIALIEANPDAAAVIIDPVGVSNGLFRRADIETDLPRIRQLCTEHDIVLIFDEIQTFGGFMGGSLFAAQEFGVTPDVICLAKAIAGGLPLAGVLCRGDLADLLSHNEAEYTNGGTPVTSAAALAFLGVYVDGRDRFRHNAQAFGKAIEELAAECPYLEFTRHGFITSFRLRADRFRELWAAKAASLANREDMILRTNNFGQDVFVKPSVLIEPEESRRQVARLTSVFDQALEAVKGAGVDRAALRTGLVARNRTPVPDLTQYFRDMLTAIGPDFEVRCRSAEEIEDLTRRLPRDGVWVNRGFASPGGVEYEPMSGATMADYLAEPISSAVVNGLLSQHQRGLESAHAHGVVIGGRWSGNAVVDQGASVRLIDFELAYSGRFETLAAFEELFALFDLAAHIAEAPIRLALLRRVAPGVFRRWPRDAPATWSGIRSVHLGRTSADPPAAAEVYPDLVGIVDQVASRL